MAAAMVKTRTPGIYKRGNRYVVRYRLDGRNMSESAATFADAQRIKRDRESARDRGELRASATAAPPITFGEYATEWVERHEVRERTRDAYRSVLGRYAIPQLGQMPLAKITHADLYKFCDWLADEAAQGQRAAAERARKPRRRPGRDEPTPLYLKDGTRHRIFAPVSACLGDAARRGVIAQNPAAGMKMKGLDRLRLPVSDDEAEPARAMTRAQLSDFLRVTPARHALLFRLLAATGLRISEASGLRWSHVTLDGSTPEVRVREANVRGTTGAPKSRESSRDVPLGHDLVIELRRARAATDFADDDDYVFADAAGEAMEYHAMYRDALVPTAQEAGLAWVTFHTFRHTCASLLFADGRNVKQVQRWLGHADPGFTLRTYVHILEGDLGGPLDLAPAPLPPSGFIVPDALPAAA